MTYEHVNTAGELGEQPAELPEIYPQTEVERALLDAVLWQGDERDDWLRNFEEAANDLIAEQHTPYLRQCAEEGLAVVRWRIFGRYNEQLPPNLVIERQSYDSTNIHPAANIARRHVGIIQLGIEDATTEVRVAWQRHIETNKDAIARPLCELIQAGPEYAILKSLMTVVPDTDELPLTSAERMARESQERRNVREMFGMSDSERVLPRTDAAIVLNKRIYKLDEETSRRHQPEADAAAEKMSAWIKSQAKQWLDNDDYDMCADVVNVVRSPQPGLYFTITDTAGNTFTSDGSEFSEWADGIVGADDRKALYKQNGYDNDLLRIFLGEYELGTDPEATLEACVNDRTQRLIGNLLADGSLTDKLDSIRRPHGNVYDESITVPEYSFPYHEMNTETQSYVADRERATSVQKEAVAVVLFRDDIPDVPRLILSQPAGTEYPKIADEYDLVIQSIGSAHPFSGFNESEPYVLGYKAVAHDGGTWYFVRDAEDPYEDGDQLVLYAEEVEELAKDFDAIGARTLSDALLSEPALTASRLAELIATHSTYTYDTSLPTLMYTPNISVFAPYVRKGRLQLQCSGAANLMRTALNTIYGDGSAKVVAGLSIGPERMISLVRHAQTQLSINGKRYVFDATPGAPVYAQPSVDPGYFDYVYDNWRFRQAERRVQARAHKQLGLERNPEPEKTDKDDRTKPIEQVRAEYANTHRADRLSRVEMILQASLSEPDSASLHRRVTTMKSNDPFRRALEAAIRTIDVDDEDLLGETVQYLRHYVAASAGTRRIAGLRVTDKGVAALLLSALT